MPIFLYKAYDAAGKAVAGTVESVSLAQAVLTLRKSGLFVKDVSPSTRGAKGFFHRGVTPIELAMATRELAVLLGSATPIHEALDMLSKEEDNGTLSMVFLYIKDSISTGSSLSGALEAHPDIFKEFYVRSIEAGEASGTLDVVLARLADYLEAKAEVQEKVKTSLQYPAIMVVTAVGVLAFLFMYIMPRMTSIFSDAGQSLPFLTVALLFLVHVLKLLWFPIIAVLLVLILGASRYLKTEDGKAFKDELLFSLPWAGRLLRKFHSAIFARTLGSLLGCGIPIIGAVDMTRKTLGNTLYDRVLRKAIKDVSEGSSLSASLKDCRIIPEMLIQMIATGEKTGEVDRMLLSAAQIYERDFERAVMRMLGLLEPALTVGLGIAVGIILLAVLLPIFEINYLVR